MDGMQNVLINEFPYVYDSFFFYGFFRFISYLESLFLKQKQTHLSLVYKESKSLRLFITAVLFLCIFGSIEKNILNNTNIKIQYFPLIILGITFRVLAIQKLGELWTFDVEIYKNHPIINKGIYKFLRHPAYFGNIFIPSLFLLFECKITAVISLAVIIMFGIYRINIENRYLYQE